MLLIQWSGPSAPLRMLFWGSLQKPHIEVHMAKREASSQQRIPPCQTHVWNTLKADRAAKPSMTAAQSDGLSWLHSAKFWALNQTLHMRNNIHCHFEEARFGVIYYSTTNTLSSVTVTMKFECTWASSCIVRAHHRNMTRELSSMTATLRCREVFVSLDFGWRLGRMCTPKSCLGRCTNGRQSANNVGLRTSLKQRKGKTKLW